MTNQIKFLTPSDMQSVLVHDKRYQRAIKLLLEDWQTDENHLFSDLIKDSDVIFARRLQASNLVTGHYQLNEYANVQKFINHHDQWLTASAKQELLRPFD